jgi:hypothetical protein
MSTAAPKYEDLDLQPQQHIPALNRGRYRANKKIMNRRSDDLCIQNSSAW